MPSQALERRAIIGVMGHVDHGKTTLVRALTGMETDRLAEEKRRGISIALGFAHLRVGDAVIDLIDMPGHERFVRTMIAGATGTDAALLVVAANEGIKPQTVEHLDIAGLLGVRRVVLAVSKVDLVSPERVRAVGEAVAGLVGAAGMTVIAQVGVSAQTGAGMPALRAALGDAVPAAAMADDGFPYLPIDRVFSVVGHGTVVTGTLRRGAMNVADEFAVAPGGRAIRLRGLHIHGARVAGGRAGQRVAINLRDVGPDEIGRGAALTGRGVLTESAWLTVALRATTGAPVMANSGKFMLLFGTEEVEARLRLLDRDALAPGGTALAQLHCARAVAVPARENFILRRISPPLTLAGGRIIDPVASRLRRHAPGVLARLAAIADADPASIVAAEVAGAGATGVALDRLAQLAGLSATRTVALLPGLPAMLGRSRWVVSRSEWERVLAAIPASLANGALAEALPGAGRAILDDAVDELVRRGVLVRGSGGVTLRSVSQDRARADGEAQAGARMAETLRRAGLNPPDIAVVLRDVGEKRTADRLVRAGEVIRAVDKVQKRELLFHQEAVETAKRVLRPLLTGGVGVTVGEAGAALGISRKFCVPLLEHLDSVRFTRRIADRRVLASMD